MNIYLADYEDGMEKKAFSSLKKACEWAKKLLEEARQTCKDEDESHIVRTQCGMYLQIRKADGRMVEFEVKITKMKVE